MNVVVFIGSSRQLIGWARCYGLSQSPMMSQIIVNIALNQSAVSMTL